MLDSNKIPRLIRMAMTEAQRGSVLGNAPFGALLLDPTGEVVLRAFNTQRSDSDPTAHAEINLLRAAGKKFQTIYFPGYAIVGDAEACSMCMSAAIKAKIVEFYFGAYSELSMDPVLPATEVASRAKQPILLHGGVLQDECAAQIASVREEQKKKFS